MYGQLKNPKHSTPGQGKKPRCIKHKGHPGHQNKEINSRSIFFHNATDLLTHVCFLVPDLHDMQMYIHFTDCCSQEQAAWYEYVWMGTIHWNVHTKIHVKV